MKRKSKKTLSKKDEDKNYQLHFNFDVLVSSVFFFFFFYSNSSLSFVLFVTFNKQANNIGKKYLFSICPQQIRKSTFSYFDITRIFIYRTHTHTHQKERKTHTRLKSHQSFFLLLFVSFFFYFFCIFFFVCLFLIFNFLFSFFDFTPCTQYTHTHIDHE